MGEVLFECDVGCGMEGEVVVVGGGFVFGVG